MSAPSEAPLAAGEPARKLAAGGVIATWARVIVVTLVGIGQAPILFANVPSSDLGVWYLFYTVAIFINLSDLGLPATLSRAVSYLWGRGRAKAGDGPEIPAIYRSASIPRLYASAMIATGLLGLAFAAVTFPAALLYFSIALPGAHPGVAVPLAIFLLGVVLNLAGAIPGACLTGAGEVALDGALKSAANLVGFALVCIFIPNHRSLLALCVIYTGQGLIAVFTGHFVLQWRRRMARSELRLDVPLVGSLYRESASMFVSRLGGWLTLESTLLVAGHFMGSSRIADYAVLRQVLTIGASVVSAIPAAISPHLSAAYSAGESDRVRSLYLAALRYALVLDVLWILGLLFWAPRVIGILVDERHFLGRGVLVPLAVGSFLELHANTHAAFCWAIGRWPFAPYVVVGGVLNLLLASLGCAFYGFEGLAWGTLAAQVLSLYWVPVAYGLAQVGVSLRAYARETLQRGAVYALVVAGAGFAARGLASRLHVPAAVGTAARLANIAPTFVGIAMTTLLAMLAAWPLMLTQGDRAYFLKLLRLRR